MRKTIGQIGFEAYGEAAGWKTFDGRPMPRWHDAGAQMAETRRRWEVAALAVAMASPLARADETPDARSDEEVPVADAAAPARARLDPLTIACPACSAAAGERCKNYRGRGCAPQVGETPAPAPTPAPLVDDRQTTVPGA